MSDIFYIILSGICGIGFIGGVCLIGVFAVMLQGQDK